MKHFKNYYNGYGCSGEKKKNPLNLFQNKYINIEMYVSNIHLKHNIETRSVLCPTGQRWEENPGRGGSHRLREVWGTSQGQKQEQKEPQQVHASALTAARQHGQSLQEVGFHSRG